MFNINYLTVYSDGQYIEKKRQRLQPSSTQNLIITMKLPMRIVIIENIIIVIHTEPL